VNTSAGTTNVTTAIASFSTDGADMAGMTVTFFYDNGSQEDLIWGATGATSGGVSMNAAIVQDGSTFTNAWTLTNASGYGITGIAFDGAPGDTIFDILNGAEHTVGSANGKAFEVSTGGSAYDIVATYSNLIALTGDAPLGDLYRNLDIEFTQTAFRTGDTLTWLADTDNAALPDDIRPIPLPSAAGMGMIGLLAVGSRRRR